MEDSTNSKSEAVLYAAQHFPHIKWDSSVEITVNGPWLVWATSNDEHCVITDMTEANLLRSISRATIATRS